ncbi:hypothetical protein HID58_084542 [Brassica napus]|uniref:Nitrate regulatory gene2 protein n=1 Tax=Brassica napus TaxID=3708 RepID=A0ABQ7XK87_BRANA|nr:protein ALTERED PHOSPHATE STARVATION RESPONSE 1 [Brassica napus]KAH0856281.1 hypothetical protein HID58_084542 [Brassica napus]
MGCAQSRVDNEEAVARCKDRRNVIKEAVTASKAFAAGHFAYAIALKNAGAALSDYGHGESDQTLDAALEKGNDRAADGPATPQPPPPPPIENLPPPPPPLPQFTPSPIKRAISLPAMAGRGRKVRGIDSMAIEEEDEEEEEEEEGEEKVEDGESSPRTPENVGKGGKLPETPETVSASPGAWDYFFRVEDVPGGNLEDNHHFEFNEEEEEEEEEEELRSGHKAVEEVEPKTPEKVEEVEEEEDEVVEEAKEKGKAKIEHSNTAPPEFRRAVAKTTASSVNLMKILDGIDDRFLKASECAQEVSKMLEATRLHYHSNFADNRGYVDHSARVMRVITWNKSLRGISNGEGGKDDQESDEHETHATVLDKLLAWEKKLYDEVKQGELMKIEYQKKVSLLNRHKKRGASAETVEKTKAAVSHLHTRYIVDMQSMDSTVSEVNRLRDDQLYPRLVSLVEGMAKMWTNMCTQHDTQLQIVGELKSLEISTSQKETTKQHHQQTRQFCTVLEEWHVQFERLVTHQKQYINSLNTWLKLNLIPIESSLKEKVSSPPRPQRPPIQALLHSWHDRLEKLPDEVAKSAISSFAAVMKTILLHQEEEMKLKEKCEETRREFIRKKQGFEEWYQKHLQKRGPTEEGVDGEEGSGRDDDHVTERRIVVETLKKRLEDEEEAYQRHCVQVREKSLNSLKIRLPEIFRALSDYAHACADSYEKLSVISQTQKATVSS